MKVKRIAGSSAGAICAGLLAVGCTPQDIADVFKCNIKWLFHGNHITVTVISVSAVMLVVSDFAPQLSTYWQHCF